MKLLLINPNRSAHITARLAASARRALAPGDMLQAVTAVQGPAAVATRPEAVLAAANALELAAEHGDAVDAIVLGISLDSGLASLRALMNPQPVTGMAESGLLTACQLGSRTGLLTLTPSTVALYRERVAELGLCGRLAGIEAPMLPQAYAAQATLDEAALAQLAASAQRLVDAGAESIVLCAAVLCGGTAQALQPRLPVPVLDALECAVHQARALATLGLPPARTGSHAAPAARDVDSRCAALARRMARH